MNLTPPLRTASGFRGFCGFLLIIFLLGSCSPSVSRSLVGNQAPPFTLNNLEGQKVSLASFTSQKPTLLVFWATWCPTCTEEIPVLNDWTKKYPALQIVGVNVQEPAERVKAFVDQRGIRYPILLDTEGEVAGLYGLVGIPAAILVGKDGSVLYFGFSLPKNIETLIRE